MRFQLIKTQQPVISAVRLAATQPIIHSNTGAKMRDLFTRGKTHLRLVAGNLVLAAISACGGGGGSKGGDANGGTGSAPVGISGRIADGYIKGAIVFWDCNDNLTLDAGETNARSGAGGAFTIPIAPSTPCKLRAEIPSTAIDEDTNLPIGKSMTMAAVDGHPEFISPLTTIVALGAATEAELNAKFLGSSAISITDDYVAAGIAGISTHNAARYAALALQAVGGNIKTSDVDARKQILSSAISTLPDEAWVSRTPVLQSALDNFLGTIPKFSAINPLSGSPSSIEFILNESAFSGVNDPRRATVQKALDAVKAYPYVVVGSNIQWRVLPYSVLTSFGASLADKTLFPATPEETLITNRILLALHEAQAANAAGLRNVNRAVGATFFKNAIDMSLTSVNSALTLVPAAGYVKNAVFFNTNIAKLKKASVISKEAASRLGDFVTLIQECGNLANDLTYLSAAPDLMSISDLKDPAINLTKCVAGMMGSDKVKAIVDTINLGSTTGGAAYNGEIIKFLKSLSDVTSLSLDLAQLSVPAAMYNETFGMLIASINSVVEINQSADAQDLIFEALLKTISDKFNAVLAREGEILIATRLKPYITALGSQFAFAHSSAIVNTTTTFKVTGTNLPATDHLDITFNGCANIQFVSQSAAQHQFTCTPTAAGTLTAVIRTLPGTTPLGSFPVAVSTTPSLCTLPQVQSNGLCVTPANVTVNIPATNFINGLNVALSANGYGADALMNAPPYGTVANAAEWVINAPPGRYELFATYASGLSRPVTISFDGTTMFTDALAAVTGGFFPANRQTLSQGIVQLPTGASIMRVARTDVFPHIKGFTLVPVSIISYPVPPTDTRYASVGGFPITSCVNDKSTGLVWEGKEDIGIRNGSTVYSNFGDYRAGDSSAYLRYVNSISLCGFNDWRMPNANELVGLIDTSSGVYPSLNLSWFPNHFWNVAYWGQSSGTLYGNPSAFVVTFAPKGGWYGPVNDFYVGAAYAVRLVR